MSPTHRAKTWYLDPRAPKIEQPHTIQKLRKSMNVAEEGETNG